MREECGKSHWQRDGAASQGEGCGDGYMLYGCERQHSEQPTSAVSKKLIPLSSAALIVLSATSSSISSQILCGELAPADESC